ncbi:MAG TPA: hypothetical protein VFV78_13975 [Vicinamibacterales bacterium]|nr:hypothetical protein [Vicinamibacterales bacterium]
MATKPARKPTRPKWKADPSDAIKLAALRWFALMAEAQAIQLYATSPANYKAICDIMRDAIKKMEKIGHTPIGDTDPDCPEGYVRCGRECAPMCDVID